MVSSCGCTTESSWSSEVVFDTAALAFDSGSGVLNAFDTILIELTAVDV